jgi:hypothetical protein
VKAYEKIEGNKLFLAESTPIMQDSGAPHCNRVIEFTISGEEAYNLKKKRIIVELT